MAVVLVSGLMEVEDAWVDWDHETGLTEEAFYAITATNGSLSPRVSSLSSITIRKQS